MAGDGGGVSRSGSLQAASWASRGGSSVAPGLGSQISKYAIAGVGQWFNLYLTAATVTVHGVTVRSDTTVAGVTVGSVTVGGVIYANRDTPCCNAQQIPRRNRHFCVALQQFLLSTHCTIFMLHCTTIFTLKTGHFVATHKGFPALHKIVAPYQSHNFINF